MLDLQVTWYALLFVLFAVYAILDGFDLGVGILHLSARNDNERRVGIIAIGPVWNGNEVWLIAAVAVMFTAFCDVYATVFSGFYLTLMLLLLLAALIFRAVAIVFRGKAESTIWKRVWDIAFGIGSFLIALFLSVAFGNLLKGVPIDEHGRYAGTILQLLNPYALLVGITGVVLMLMHGAAYLAVKSDGDLQWRSRRFAGRIWLLFVLLYIACLVYSFIDAPHLFANWGDKLVVYPLFAMLIVGLSIIPRATLKTKDMQTFVGTSLTMFATVLLCGVCLFPYLAISTLAGGKSLDVYNTTSSPHTLKVMIIVCIGLPFVIAYTAGVYWVFRGKVKLSSGGY